MLVNELTLHGRPNQDPGSGNRCLKHQYEGYTPVHDNMQNIVNYLKRHNYCIFTEGRTGTAELRSYENISTLEAI